MGFRPALPFVLSKDDKVRVARSVVDALDYVTFRVEPTCVCQATYGFFAERCRRCLGIQGQLQGEIGGHLFHAARLE
jgi:hypothetical protein